jgi:hypothetical protein
MMITKRIQLMRSSGGRDKEDALMEGLLLKVKSFVMRVKRIEVVMGVSLELRNYQEIMFNI